jgi:polyvinyl alcohol dehydrogenase (cytochrome)
LRENWPLNCVMYPMPSHGHSMAARIALVALIALLGSMSRSYAGAGMADKSDQFATTRSQSGPGADIFNAHCASCHAANLPKVPNQGVLQMMRARTIYSVLVAGVMRTQGASLSDQEKRMVAEYLTSAPISDDDSRAYLKMCAGNLLLFNEKETPLSTGWGLSVGNTHFVSETSSALRPDNVAKMKLKWVFAYPDGIHSRSQPAVGGGAVYVGGDDGTVYALERNTGCVRWTFSAAAEVRAGMVLSPWASSAPKLGGVLYFGDFLGNVYALNARTGGLIWQTKPEVHPASTISGAPLLYDGALYVPISSMETVSAGSAQYECCTFRGAVVALDSATGRTRWTTYAIERVATPQGKSAVGVTQYGPSGAPIWNSPVADARRGRIYFGTGQNYSSPTSQTSDSVFAVDMKTGHIEWVYQSQRGDAWNVACLGGGGANCPKENGPDYDFGAGIMLLTGHDGHDVVIAGQKSGWVHAIDPESGKLIWKTKVGAGGILGGVHFGMAADKEALFIPISDVEDGRLLSEPRRPGLYALDLRTGEFLWKSPLKDTCGAKPNCRTGYSAAITATSGLVLAGSVDGVLRIHDARSGVVLRQIETDKEFQTVSGEVGHGGGMSGGAAPVPYKNQLFLNSGYGYAGFMPGNVLLAFDLED